MVPFNNLLSRVTWVRAGKRTSWVLFVVREVNEFLGIVWGQSGLEAAIESLVI